MTQRRRGRALVLQRLRSELSSGTSDRGRDDVAQVADDRVVGLRVLADEPEQREGQQRAGNSDISE